MAGQEEGQTDVHQAFFCAHLRLSPAFENPEKLSFCNFYLSFLKTLFSNFNFNPGKPVIFEGKNLIFGSDFLAYPHISKLCIKAPQKVAFIS